MALFPTKKEFKSFEKSKAAVIPVGIELPIDMLTPIHIYNAIDKAGYKKKFILESADGGEDAMKLRVAEQYIQQFGHLAQSTNSMIVPANVSDIAGMIGGAMNAMRLNKPDGQQA